MGTDYGPGDPRSHPRRGVRVRPMPVMTHVQFRAFLEQVQLLVMEHRDTWRLAKIEDPTSVYAQDMHTYWSHAFKFLNYLEYLGTSNDPFRHPQRPADPTGRDPG